MDRAKPTTINHINWFITQRKKKSVTSLSSAFPLPRPRPRPLPRPLPRPRPPNPPRKPPRPPPAGSESAICCEEGKKIKLKFAHKFYVHQVIFSISIRKTKVGRFHWLDKPKSIQPHFHFKIASKVVQNRVQNGHNITGIRCRVINVSTSLRLVQMRGDFTSTFRFTYVMSLRDWEGIR